MPSRTRLGFDRAALHPVPYCEGSCNSASGATARLRAQLERYTSAGQPCRAPGQNTAQLLTEPGTLLQDLSRQLLGEDGGPVKIGVVPQSLQGGECSAPSLPSRTKSRLSTWATSRATFRRTF